MYMGQKLLLDRSLQMLMPIGVVDVIAVLRIIWYQTKNQTFRRYTVSFLGLNEMT